MRARQRLRRLLLTGAGAMVALLAARSVSAQGLWPMRVQMVPIGSSQALPVVAEGLTIAIDGQHATTRLDQVFHNSTAMNVEGQYTLWAGPGARANGFAYWNGEQKIVGEVFEKETARQVYQRVVQRRRDPGLLEEKSDGEFSFVVSPIAPDEKKRVEVVYSRWLARRNGVIDVQAPIARADAEITVTIADGRELKNFASSTHEIEVKQLGSGKILVRATRPRAEAKQFSLHYEVVERPWTVAAYVHRNRGQDGYFALTLASPTSAQQTRLPKDVTLVIDHSGSMFGEKLKQAREACLDILKRLSRQDRVNVMLFDDRVETLFKVPEPVTAETRAKAAEYVVLMQAGGGTNLDLALKAALSAQVESPRPRVVLFFTDGRSDADPVIQVATKDKHDARVFTIGLGRDINRPLLSRLAALKRGRFTYIPEASSIEREVATLFGQIEAPVLIDLSLESKNGSVMTTYPRTLPDLFNNDELLITGRLRGKGKVELILKAKDSGQAVAYRTEVALGDEMIRPWVGRLWAKSRIDDLLEEINLKGPNKELSDEVTELALAYNFVTPYTSFLAIPESEVDAVSAQDLAGARARKQEVMKRKSGAIQLAEPEGPDILLRDQISPSPVARSAQPQVVTDEGEDGSQDPTMVTDDSTSIPEGVKDLGRNEGRKGGCASCNLGGHNETSGLAALAMLAAFAGLRRIRRKRSQ
ncbi:MAG TPA: VIT and VWA domain-containing protein [Polyangia bacterium]